MNGRRTGWIWVVAVAACVVVMVSGRAAPPDSKPNPKGPTFKPVAPQPDPSQVPPMPFKGDKVVGEKLFKQHCAKCHQDPAQSIDKGAKPNEHFLFAAQILMIRKLAAGEIQMFHENDAEAQAKKNKEQAAIFSPLTDKDLRHLAALASFATGPKFVVEGKAPKNTTLRLLAVDGYLESPETKVTANGTYGFENVFAGNYVLRPFNGNTKITPSFATVNLDHNTSAATPQGKDPIVAPAKETTVSGVDFEEKK